MQVRDRIREFRRVPARELRPHPMNWRTHPKAQQDALRGVLAEIGYAGALLARQDSDGTLELIDGHLRAETTPDMEVPVLVLDVTAAEAATLLAVLDPLAGLAETDRGRLDALLADVETECTAVRELLDRLASRRAELDAEPPVDRPPPELEPSYQVVVACDDEQQQRAVYERLTGEGLSCRLLVL